MSVAAFAILRDSSADAPSGVPAGVRRWDYRSAVDDHEDWALLWPGQRHDLWAVVLHGHGSGGDQLFSRADLRNHWLPALRGHGLGILCPHLRGNAWMGPAAAADLCDLLAAVRQHFGVSRFIITGGSMGGTAALTYSALHPADVAGCVACCPATDLSRYVRWCRSRSGMANEIRQAIAASYGGEPEERSELYARHSACAQAHRLIMPVAMAHAAGDPLIPVDEPRQLVKAFAGRGSLRYDEQPAGNHDSSLSLYPSLLDWVMDQVC